MPRTLFPFRVSFRGFSKPLTGLAAVAGLFAAALAVQGENAHAGNSLLLQHVAGDMKGGMKSGRTGGMRELRPRKGEYNGSGNSGSRHGSSGMASHDGSKYDSSKYDSAKYDGGYDDGSRYRKRDGLHNTNNNFNNNGLGGGGFGGGGFGGGGVF